MTVRRLLLSASLSAAALVGVAFALHTPAGFALLARLGVGCPAVAPPDAVEAARLSAARAARGDRPAPARPALGFSLDETTRAEVEAWASRSGVDCTAKRAGTVLFCQNVPASALPGGLPADRLDFAFSPEDSRLVTVTTHRGHLSAEAAVEALDAIASTLSASLGPAEWSGEANADFVRAHRYRTASARWRFTDFLARITATHFGERTALREHYMSASEPALALR